MTSPTTNSAGELPLSDLIEKLEYWGNPIQRMQNDKAPIKGYMRQAAALLRRTASPGCVSAFDEIKEAYEAGALAVHREWLAADEQGEGPPRGDPQFGEAARDYARSILALTPSGEAALTAEECKLLQTLAQAIVDGQCGDMRDIIGITERQHYLLPQILRRIANAPLPDAGAVAMREALTSTLASLAARKDELVEEAKARIEHLSLGYEAIREGLTAGRVGGEDIVWYSQIETLWDFCGHMLHGNTPPEFDELKPLVEQLAEARQRALAAEAKLSSIEAETREACALIAANVKQEADSKIRGLYYEERYGMECRKDAAEEIETAIRASAQKGGV